MANSPYDQVVEVIESRSWSEEAACLDFPISDFFRFYHEGVEAFLARVSKHGETLSCPPTCPVMAECALEALIWKDTDVIRAGKFIHPHRGKSVTKIRRELKKVAGPLMTKENEKLIESRLDQTHKNFDLDRKMRRV